MKTKLITCCAVLCCVCAACASRDALDNRGPDEYMVVSNPPLVLPPDFTLRAPEKQSADNAPNALEQKIKKSAAARDVQKEKSALSDGDRALLGKTGAGDENIRETLTQDREKYEKETPVLDKALKGNPSDKGVSAEQAEQTVKKRPENQQKAQVKNAPEKKTQAKKTSAKKTQAKKRTKTTAKKKGKK